ncbi:FHA domain-containing protein [Actinomadura roseirufa]|uniref:FHA domain-containing protein n=1 Tax=Actinomadura roseirufa TaxID=2094049 RepID=UPI001040FB12|nr:FHA domain-containing protein [Actinomadura roseirufa]
MDGTSSTARTSAGWPTTTRSAVATRGCTGTPTFCWSNDLGSRNRTFVNGRQVTAPTPLGPGDVLRLGLDVEVPVVEIDEHGEPKDTL